MSNPAERLREFYCGLTDERWERRLIMPLQFFMDESGNAPNQQVIACAGLLATGPRWQAFLRDWEAARLRAPAVAAVKYCDVKNLAGEFHREKGWTEQLRDQRLAEFVALIRKHCLGLIWTGLHHEHFQKYVRSVPSVYRCLLSDMPNAIVAGSATLLAGSLLHALGLTAKCDAFFDEIEQQQEALIFDLWPDYRDNAANAFGLDSMQFCRRPHFVTDEDYPMLQASDLMAGLTRDRLMGEAVHPAFDLLKDLPEQGQMMGEDHMQRMGAIAQRSAARLRERFPTAPVHEFDPERHRQIRKGFARQRRENLKRNQP